MTEKWMTCTTCKAIVQLNATGICLGCQMGFTGQHEDDKYMPEETKLKEKNEEIADLVDRQKELEDALQKHKPAQVPIQSKAKVSKGVRNSNSKRKKTTKQSKEE